ncbi:MAG: ferrochelatase [Gammaproteobacteria bacterium]
MPRFAGEADFQHDSADTLGVLLVNLGTPDEPSPAAVRRYLAEFLWDPRVIEVPRPIWWLILHGVILRIRPKRSAAAYAKVWTDEGSPLMVWSVKQRAALQRQLDSALPGPVHVALGMRYGKPSVADALQELRNKQVRRLLVLPLYPQYSATTTATAFDAIAAALARQRWIPELRFINQYHDETGYIGALAASVREHWASDGRGEHLLMSFHGLPRRYLLAGDPYHCHCQKTGRLLAEALFLKDDEWSLSFQSRVGREEWLRPYTDERVQDLGKAGVRHIDVICPGFSADCLETLEEIAMQNQEFFIEAGGERLSYVPALNARRDHISFLTQLVLRHLQGWPETSPAWDEETHKSERIKRAERAKASGA